MYADPTCGANTARFAFLNPAGRQFYRDWERVTHATVGALRMEAGKNPYDRDLSNLIGELSTRNDAFRMMWGSHDVHVFHEGTKRLHHPVVGELELEHETMRLPDDSGLILVVYSAPAGTADADGLKLLASWSANAADHEHNAGAGSPNWSMESVQLRSLLSAGAYSPGHGFAGKSSAPPRARSERPGAGTQPAPWIADGPDG